MGDIAQEGTTVDNAFTVRKWQFGIAYDGTSFNGWQVQPGQRTVQGEILDRLRRIFGDPELRLYGMSRTDSGVHALDQQASFTAASPPGMDAERLRYILNRWLPASIKITHAREAEPDFHARHSAKGKGYTYVLYTGDKINPLFANYVWSCAWKIDIARMQQAAKHFEGLQDFGSFATNANREISTFVRELHRVEVLPIGDLVCFNVVGKSFLYKMVRAIVGWLVFVGRGMAEPDDTLRVLQARDRCAADASAPAQGLFLAKAFFDENEWRDYTPKLPPFTW